MLHIIFTVLLALAAIATLWFSVYVIKRLFTTEAPATAQPSASAQTQDESAA